MLARVTLAALLMTTAPVVASQRVAIHATTAAAIVADPVHVRTLRDELAQSVGLIPTGFTVDVSLVRLDTTSVRGGQIEVRAEVRAALSDAKGVMRWSASARSMASGRARDRALLQRDAITGAARHLGTRLATR